MDLMITFQCATAEESDIVHAKINDLLKQSKESKISSETPNPMSVESAVQQLQGATSGADWCVGFVFGLEVYGPQR